MLFVLVVTPAIAKSQGDDEVQCLKAKVPPPYEIVFRALVFNGDVTIGGSAPSRQGYTITARIGDLWESTAVPVGVGHGCGSGRYEHLIVDPPEDLDLFGSQITFWLNGQVLSGVIHWYTVFDHRNPPDFYGHMTWTFPLLRQVDLEFPALPDDSRLDGTLPATGGTSSSKPMLAVFLLTGLLTTVSGLVAAGR